MLSASAVSRLEHDMEATLATSLQSRASNAVPADQPGKAHTGEATSAVTAASSAESNPGISQALSTPDICASSIEDDIEANATFASSTSSSHSEGGEEARQEGAVSLTVYRFYLRSVGAFITSIVIISIILMQVSGSTIDLGLSGATRRLCAYMHVHSHWII